MISMTRDEAISELVNLVYDFHNHMVTHGIKELSADEWLEEFRHWLPAGKVFAERCEDLIKWRQHDKAAE